MGQPGNPDSIAIDIHDAAPQVHHDMDRKGSDKKPRRSLGLWKATEDATGGAMSMASQPLKYAGTIGYNMGGLVLGELGYTMPGTNPGSDPSMIKCLGEAKHCRVVRSGAMHSIPEDSGATQSTSPDHPPANHQAISPDESVSNTRYPPLGQARDGAKTVENQQGQGDYVEDLEEKHAEALSRDSQDEARNLGNRESSGLQSMQSDATMVSTLSRSSSDDKKLSDDETNSAATGDMAGGGTCHYDPENDVILRLEAMTAGEVRGLNFWLWIWLIAAAGLLLWQFIEKLKQADIVLNNFQYIILNSAVGSVMFILVTCFLLSHAIAVKANWQKTWKPRRTKTTVIVTLDLFVQWLNLLFLIIPNFINLRTGPCMAKSANEAISWFVLGRWTCYNTLFCIAVIQAHNSNISAAYAKKYGRVAGHGRTNLSKENDKSMTVVADLPFWTVHWWKIVLWACMECSIIAVVAYAVVQSRRHNHLWHGTTVFCNDTSPKYSCNIGRGAVITSSIMVAFAGVYFILYCVFLRRALTQLRAHSTVEYKFANTIVRVQMRLRLPAFAFFTVSVFLLWFVRPYSCTSVVTTWFGMLPNQMAATIVSLSMSWVGSPKRCLGKGRPPLLQVWLQEFAWTKAETAERMERRNASMAVEDKSKIEKEPMFCVEAMLVCLYWSLLIYDFEEDGQQTTEKGDMKNAKSRLSIEDACSLFRPPMDRYEVFWEKGLDTKCLMAWSRKEIILVFRGTASLTNVVADVQAWRTYHHPRRGSFWRQPKVHSGFDRAYRNNGLNERIFDKLKEIFATGQVDKDDYRYYVTGHSYGGALATLSAFDTRSMGKKHGRDKRLTCITFGAPRTGDHNFAREYNEMVPDSWNVINDQDLIARGGKFIWMYKRGGHRVIINRLGDLIVRPSPLEASLRILPLQGSVQQHLLTSYLESIVAVLLSQFSKKHKSSAVMARIVDIVRHNKPLQDLIFCECGLDLKDLIQMSRWGGYAPLVAQYHEKSLGRRSTASTGDYCSRPSSSCRWIDRFCGALCINIETFGSRHLGMKWQPGSNVPNTKDGERTENPRRSQDSMGGIREETHDSKTGSLLNR